jgi:D-alanyl-D-alanine carboxypeptidase
MAGLCFTPAMAKSRARQQKNPPNSKYAAYVIEAGTGRVLFARNENKRLHPASVTKIMTLMMMFDALQRGRFTINSQIPVSRYATTMAPSKLNLRAGDKIRVEDAIYALVTKSANDIAVVIAESIGGTENEFANMMTRRAHEIGMQNTTFKNASGLHNSGQLTTVHDMAILAQYILKHYPQYYHYFSKRNFTYKGQVYHNHNHLMKSYQGMDGLKTGFINPSGFNLVASAKRNNVRLIGVVFGGQSTASRNAHMAEILDAGFLALKKDPQYRYADSTPETEQDKAAQNQTAQANINADILSKPRNENPNQQFLSAPPSTNAPTKQYKQILRAPTTFQDSVQNPSLSSALPLWSVQVGAYASRSSAEYSLKEILSGLPRPLSAKQPVVIPVKTRSGWLFRGRLVGMTQEEAKKTCKILSQCMTIAPTQRISG